MKQLGGIRTCAFRVLVEEACPAGLHHSRFSCGNHQPKVFFKIPDVLAATTTDEGSSQLPKRLVFQRKPLVGDFRRRTLNDATQPDKLLQQVHLYSKIATPCGFGSGCNSLLPYKNIYVPMLACVQRLDTDVRCVRCEMFLPVSLVPAALLALPHT